MKHTSFEAVMFTEDNVFEVAAWCDGNVMRDGRIKIGYMRPAIPGEDFIVRMLDTGLFAPVDRRTVEQFYEEAE